MEKMFQTARLNRKIASQAIELAAILYQLSVASRQLPAGS